jgi:crotonobetainyl-CoA:carnitine CoA-transferase CaiB-like acyl-CoA transferase
MNGEKNALPLKMPVALIDILAAHQLKEGVLCALIKKLKSGKGSRVTVSLYDAAIASLANQATNWLMNKEIPQAIGSQHPNIAPYGDMYLTKDEKWIVLAVGSEKQFAELCKCLSLENALLNTGFKSNQNRVKNRIELNEILSNKISFLNLGEIEAKFFQNKVPFGVVKNMREVFENKAAQKLILEENIDGVLTKRVKTAVFNIC